MRTRGFALVMVILIAFPLMAQTRVLAQQNDPCQFNLSQLIAGLVEAQAAASSGQPQGALTVMRAAAEALTILADQCEASLAGTSAAVTPQAGDITSVAEVTPEATAFIAVPGVFVAEGGAFTVNYPETWVTSDYLAISDSEGALTLADSEDTLSAISVQSPVLAAGQQGLQVIIGTPDNLTNFELNQASLDQMLAYFVGTFERTYPELGEATTVVIGDRTVGRLEFGGDAFDAVLYLVELEAQSRFAVIAGIGAKGERDALIPIVESAVLTLR